MYKRILVPFDGSDTATQALAAGLQLAQEGDGRVRVLHALDELAYLSGYEYSAEALRAARTRAEKGMEKAMELANAAKVPADTRLVEAPGRRLGDVAAEEARAWQADLVVVGTHGRRGIGRVLMGSGAEDVIRQAPVPVLVVRAPEAKS